MRLSITPSLFNFLRIEVNFSGNPFVIILSHPKTSEQQLLLVSLDIFCSRKHVKNMPCSFLFFRVILTWCCLPHFSLTASTENWTMNWCEVPGPPIRIIEAFKSEPKNELLEENKYTPTRGLGSRQFKGTTVFAGCIEGYTAIFTAHSSAKITCVSSGNETAKWGVDFPACSVMNLKFYWAVIIQLWAPYVWLQNATSAGGWGQKQTSTSTTANNY